MNTFWFRRLFNLYPPYLGAGVRVTDISPDWRFVRVRMPLRWYNRNYVGTHFGGSLYAMADPFLMIMIIKNLGDGYVVWDKAAEIEFIRPGRGTMTAEFRITDENLDAMRSATANGEKHLPWFTVEIRGEDEAPVARVRKQLYVRRKEQRARNEARDRTP